MQGWQTYTRLNSEVYTNIQEYGRFKNFIRAGFYASKKKSCSYIGCKVFLEKYLRSFSIVFICIRFFVCEEVALRDERLRLETRRHKNSAFYRESSAPMAPKRFRLALLPSGPDAVRGLSPHGTGFPIKDTCLCNWYTIYQNGVPVEIRTRDLRLRRPTLYPTELQAQFAHLVIIS